MIKEKGLIILLLSIVLSSAGQSVGKYKYIKPINNPDRVKIVVKDNIRSYYPLTADKGKVVQVRGPGILKVRSRVQFLEKGQTVSYRIRYSLDGEPMREESLSSHAAENARYKDDVHGKPGNLEDFNIELGRGEHSIELFSIGNSPMVATRYKFIPGKTKKKDWISYCPLTPSEPENLLARESSVTYYRFSEDSPLRVSVNGPTELRVLTRIENHYDMRGRINYRIQVKESGKVINTYQLSSVRSGITTYESNKNLIPGKAREFVIDVPRGKHTYEIMLLDKDKSTVLGRLLIPKKDVSLE